MSCMGPPATPDRSASGRRAPRPKASSPWMRCTGGGCGRDLGVGSLRVEGGASGKPWCRPYASPPFAAFAGAGAPGRTRFPLKWTLGHRLSLRSSARSSSCTSFPSTPSARPGCECELWDSSDFASGTQMDSGVVLLLALHNHCHDHCYHLWFFQHLCETGKSAVHQIHDGVLVLASVRYAVCAPEQDAFWVHNPPP